MSNVIDLKKYLSNQVNEADVSFKLPFPNEFVADSIRECLQQINFTRISIVMNLLGWEHVTNRSEEQLFEFAGALAARGYIRALEENRTHSILSSGGFECTTDFSDGSLYVDIKFVLESWDQRFEYVPANMLN